MRAFNEHPRRSGYAALRAACRAQVTQASSAFRGLLLVCVALPAAAADVTQHRINTFTGAGIQAPTHDVVMPANTHFNMNRPFNAGAQAFTALINGHTGRVQLRAIGSGATLGAVTSDTTRLEFRSTNAAVLSLAGGATLALHDAFAGTLRLVNITPAGTLVGTGVEHRYESLKDKNLFDIYQRAGRWHFFALDTFSGDAASYTDTGFELKTETWSLGWSSVDHLTAGAGTHRILYKAAGDPTLLRGEAGDNEGMLVVQRVANTGMNEGNTQVINIDAGYSHVRFVRLGTAPVYRVLAYDRKTGYSKHAPFDPNSGTITGPFTAPVNATSKWAEVEPFFAGGLSRIAFLADDGVEPFHYDQAERMALSIHDRLKTRAVGYQYVLMQSGRLIGRRAWGYVGLGSEEKAMTNRLRMDVGSVSKMIMATSMLELSRRGTVDLDAPLRSAINPAAAAGWVDTFTLKNAMTHTTGMPKDSPGCSGNSTLLTMDCLPFYAAEQSGELESPTPSADVTDDYRREYVNSNIALARDVFTWKLSAATSPHVVDEVFNLWASHMGADREQLSCQHRPDVYYFGQCRGAGGCQEHLSGVYQQSRIIEDWSNNCSAGGWAASSRQLSEFLTAVRYRKLMFGAAPEQGLLTNVTLTSGNSATAFGWDAPTTFNGVATLGKGGANGDRDSTAAFNAHILRLPNNIDAVLLVNTAGIDSGDLLAEGYRYGISTLNEPSPYVIEDLLQVEGTYDRLALNAPPENHLFPSRYVTASRNAANGRLQLDAFRVDPGQGLTLTDSESADAILSVAVTDGLQFVTAVRDALGRLQLTWWNHHNGALSRLGSWLGDTVSEIDVTRVGTPVDGVTRAVVVSRRGDGQLTLQTVDHAPGNVATRRDTEVVAAGTGAAVQTLRWASTGAPSGRVVLGFRNAAGQLELQTWEVASDGALTQLGTLARAAVISGQSAKRVAIDQVGDRTPFFNSGFVTVHVTPESEAEHRSWEVAANGAITELATVAGTSATSVDAMGLITTQRRETGGMTVKRWSVAGNGTLTLLDGETYPNVNQAMTAGDRLIAYRNGTDELKVLTFSVVP